MRLEGETLSPGVAEGELMLLEQPLSLWGGMDLDTGRIIDRHHPQCGSSVTGRILGMTSGRGSSSSTSVLAESIRVGSAPAGLVLAERDIVIALGAMVADLLYGLRCPVIRLAPEVFGQLQTPALVRIIAGSESASLEALPEDAGR